jgi:hypothetical protein
MLFFGDGAILDDSKLSERQKERINRIMLYASKHNCMYVGWATCPGTEKFHYFIDSESLCTRHQHFGKPREDKDLSYIPNHPYIQVCKRCLKKYEQMKKEMNK